MERPKVGIAVAIRHSSRSLYDGVLLGLRQGGHAPGMWGFTGGYLEGGETFEQCAIRETKEESGIVLSSVQFWTVENIIFDAEGKHFVTVFMVADMPADQSARVMEPNKCLKWELFPWAHLPSPIMPGIVQLVQRGANPFEI